MAPVAIRQRGNSYELVNLVRVQLADWMAVPSADAVLVRIVSCWLQGQDGNESKCIFTWI